MFLSLHFPKFLGLRPSHPGPGSPRECEAEVFGGATSKPRIAPLLPTPHSILLISVPDTSVGTADMISD